MQLHWLCEFIGDTLSDYETKVHVALLIKDSITVIVDLYDALNNAYLHEDGCNSNSGIDNPGMLHRRGLLDSSNLIIYQIIKDISYVFTIRKIISRGDGHGGSYLPRSLRSYWDPPIETARQKVR
ncbi:hypothetical protein DER46DRAFT_681589 [Fusarium sp. MPI-SDFR-AT-0072]|nr:hypothetical protein DER46DRAFT_681589 [Fusarium sp. MPI-SDFR-AT-0072]